MKSLPAQQDQNDIIIKCSLKDMANDFYKDYEIIWHDPHVNSEENQQHLTHLKKLCRVRTFTEWKEAEDYIKTAKTVCHVITSGTNGELLVKEIFSSENVPNILTFCRDNRDHHSTWAKNYQKVLCTETKIEDVILKIQKNLFEWHKQTSSLKFDLPAFAPIFDASDKSQMNHLHLYLKMIPSFQNRFQAKMDIVNLSKAIYSDKKSEKFIADFEQTYGEYNKEAILKWYTQQSFLYKVVNNCLRIASSDSIQWSRFLLKDIERAIKDQYHTKSKSFSGLLYRAAYLSKKEWLSLKDNINREIEMHGFLSVSKEKSIALKFMGVNPARKVFITILVPKGPFEEEQGFAEIDEFSKFPQEKEILFNVRSRFTILEAEDEYSDDLPYRHLVLLYGAQGLRRFLAEEDPSQQVLIEDIKDIFCSRCKVPSGEVAEKMFFLSLVDLEKRIYSCQRCLDNGVTAPFLCIPVREKILTIKIKGCLLTHSSQTKLPLYGYKCSQCEIKRQKRYFVCADCSERGKRWCQGCFEDTSSCIEVGHSVILEGYPFSFWCEKMSENELTHMKYQNDFVVAQDHLFQQAEMFHQTHKYEKAVEYYNLYLSQNEAKGRDGKLADLYNNIGIVFENQGQYKKALECHLKSLEIYKSVNEEENSSQIAISYGNIGSVYQSQGDDKKALKYYLKSREIFKSAHEEDLPGISTCYSNIGLVYSNQGEYNKSLEYQLKSLYIYKSLYGENHPSVGTCYSNIGGVYNNQRDYKKAIEYYLKCLDIYKSTYGENHPSVGACYSNIGGVYDDQKDYKKALEYYLRSLEIRKLVYGECHPDVAATYTNIGFIYENEREYSKALEYHLKSPDIYKSVYGENHSSVAISYNNIGMVYNHQGQYKIALEYYLRSLEIKKLIYGECHPDVAFAYDNIGMIYKNERELIKALKYYLKSLEIKKLVYGECHPDVAIAYDNIGYVYEDQGDDKKALKYYLRSLVIRKIVNGEDLPGLATFIAISDLYIENKESTIRA